MQWKRETPEMTIIMLLGFFFIFFVVGTHAMGKPCLYTWSCPEDNFCAAGRCRKKVCAESNECQADEACLYGKIGDQYGNACFPVSQKNDCDAKHCPGGGKVIRFTNGEAETCDVQNPCTAKGICNPQHGVCCTKLRLCFAPARPLIDLMINKPVICRMGRGPATVCPKGTYCEMSTGFCCGVNSSAIGASCNPNEGCDGNAACMCGDTTSCSCQCPAELGYTSDSDGTHCKRIRRRLKEKCKSNSECQAAYSECTSGGCRCRTGFQRDGKGGCKPTTYRCVNEQKPLMNGTTIRNCRIQIKPRNDANNLEQYRGSLNERSDDELVSDCPSGYYCVPLFDIPRRTLLYQGFCCPLPVEQWPFCPVGIAHETSSAPLFGCDKCPADHFCHRDTLVINKEICCPKACVNIDDIYVNGECYPIVRLGEKCSISEQCIAADNPSNEAIKCVQGICTCPMGYHAIDGVCKRLICMVGMGGEPSIDANNVLIRCSNNYECAQGYICDIENNICCKRNNRKYLLRLQKIKSSLGTKNEEIFP